MSGASCKLFANSYKKDYVRHAASPLDKRRNVATDMVPVVYGDFIKRQPDGYVSTSYRQPVREPYFPSENETEWLERMADYLLAEDHAQGLTIIRDPYDKPRDEDVYTPPGDGAIRFMRSRVTEEDAVSRLLSDFDRMKRTAYVNSDYAAIEYLADVEAAINAAEATTVESIAESLKAADVAVSRRFVPEIDIGSGNHVKRCVVCDFPFEDNSPAKKAKVCGKSCRRRYRTLWQRVDRYGTEELEGERDRMQIDYPFYSPEEMRILEERSESAYGDSEKVSGMIAAKQRKERQGVKHTVKLVDKHGTYTFTSDRNAYKFDSWDRRWKWGEIASYNKNERPLTEKFVECRGLAARLCTWLS